ncbi:MAG: hypothetical protein Q9M25_05545 [Mariprofundaceae bacterium]|nr:hypothetical protein [Mariprofundaceae bacterium]
MKKYLLATGAILVLTVIALGLPVQAKITAGDVTGGVKAPHVNIAIFHKLHGQDGFTYPKNIAKAEILHAMDGKAQFISINHTAGLKDGDVVTIANDVLREDAGHFGDFGVDCQMSIHIKGSDVTLAGMCQILIVDQDHREINHKGIVKATTIDAGSGWKLIYYDAEDGIAVYAESEVGLE